MYLHLTTPYMNDPDEPPDEPADFLPELQKKKNERRTSNKK